MDKYLRAIYRLTDKGEGSTKTSEVAEELDVSDASASEAVSKLQEEGLVCKADYKGFTLSPIGKKQAEKNSELYRKTVEHLREQEVEDAEEEAELMIDSMSETAVEKIVSR